MIVSPAPITGLCIKIIAYLYLHASIFCRIFLLTFLAIGYIMHTQSRRYHYGTHSISSNCI
ncbi:hypothetical protein Deiofobo_0385 [Pseudomonas phage Deifobo]|nr:hypothetical protein Deiofobo_0385 [Pseudomonas phage Deifobo]